MSSNGETADAIAARPRGVKSTAAISFIFSAFAGYLWIGRGRQALCFAIGATLVSFAAIGVVLAGVLPPLPVLVWLTPYFPFLAFILVGLISIILVMPSRQESRPDRWYARSWGFLVSLLGYLLVGSIIGEGIRGLVVQTFSVPSSSMEPTLREGDYFTVDKSAYGWSHYSFSYDFGPASGRILSAMPKRGDIVTLRHPGVPGVDYVERLIGLPGDRVQMIEGILHLNGQPAKVEAVGPTQNGLDGRPATILRETLPDGTSYLIQDMTADGMADDTQEFVVPDNHFFLLGDNRDNSNDSRIELGFVPFENLLGRAEWIYWNSAGVEYRDRRDLLPQRAGQ